MAFVSGAPDGGVSGGAGTVGAGQDKTKPHTVEKPATRRGADDRFSSSALPREETKKKRRFCTIGVCGLMFALVFAAKPRRAAKQNMRVLPRGNDWYLIFAMDDPPGIPYREFQGSETYARQLPGQFRQDGSAMHGLHRLWAATSAECSTDDELLRGRFPGGWEAARVKRVNPFLPSRAPSRRRLRAVWFSAEIPSP